MNNNIDFEKVDCLFCGSKAKKELLYKTPDRFNKKPGTFSLVKCESCGLVFQDPRPKEKCIGYFYPDGWYPKPRKEVDLSQIDRLVYSNFFGYPIAFKNIFLKTLLAPIYCMKYRSRSIPRYRKDGCLLEIGCATGERLRDLKKLGWKVCGIEIDKKAAKIAKDQLGLSVQDCSIFDADYPKNSFDVIILDMVIGNLYNPDQAFKKITPWLKSGGQLIFSDPYFEGLEYRIFKDYCYGLQLPTHITFFNQKLIKRLFSSHYEDLKFHFHSFDRDMVASAQYKFKDSPNLIYRLIGYNRFVRFFLLKPFLVIYSLIGKTSRVTVFATKR